MNALNRFLDPGALARIKNLDLLARSVVDGFMAGLHASPHLGVSTDFAEHRPYMPGDDIRRIDWRLYGRSDRLYMKEFEAETNADVMLLIDVSASMNYGSGAITKLDYARYLAACLAYFSHRQRDRVGVITFDQDVLAQVPASGRRIDTVLHTIDQIKPGGKGEINTPLRRIAKGIRRRGILILISDFYDDPEVIRGATSHLALKGNDLIALHVLDPQELDFDFDQPSRFEDMESAEQIPVVPDRIRAEYQGLVKSHVERVSQLLGESRVDYCQIKTDAPLDHALHDYLSRRRHLRRR